MNVLGLKFGKGDIDGFLGLFVDNLAVFLIIISLNLFVVGMPPEIVFGRILPGAGMGLLAGNLYYAYMAKRLGKKEGRDDVTALPSGISIVFAIVYTMGILLPVKIITGDPEMAWMIGVAATIIGSLICVLGAIIGPWLRRFIPRTAMLGALAGIAVMYIAGQNLAVIFDDPIIGFFSLAVVLWAYVAKGQLPFKLPAGLVALIFGSLIALLMGKTAIDFTGIGFNGPFPWIFHLGAQTFVESINFISIIIPVAVINFIATLNNVESAHSAGDEFPVREAMLADAGASLIGAVFGCCYPNNVFIGHPGYKKMGAKMGYSLISGVLLAIFAFFGLFSFINAAVPMAAVLPILIFIGVVMTSGAFSEVKKEHYVASAIALIPFVGEFAYEQINMVLGSLGVQATGDVVAGMKAAGLQYSGYSSLAYGTILISMLLASIVSFAISKEMKKVAAVSTVAACFAFFGIIHVPEMGINASPNLTIAWLIVAAMAFAADRFGKKSSGSDDNIKAQGEN
ncbi:MAG: hypothetical protein HGJ97_13055 [Desulfosporosinus sp.]|nr:hypothetical protein [Desulfosporosinus sp.]